MNKKELIFLLNQLSIRPNKKLGQNFLIDNNIANKIISESKVSEEDIVLEVGPGLGALTKPILEKASKVYAIEIDSKLSNYLTDKLSSYSNLEVINGNILDIDLPDHNKIISNIPYSITGPLLEKLFFNQNPPQGILTIEKSIADRIFLREKQNYKKFSRITVTTNAFIEPMKQVKIPRKSFYPIPSIDLSLISLNPKEDINPFLLNNKKKKFFLKFIAGIMPYKNKDIANALVLFCKADNIDLNKEEIKDILNKKNYENNKLLMFNIEDFVELSRIFFEISNQDSEKGE